MAVERVIDDPMVNGGLVVDGGSYLDDGALQAKALHGAYTYSTDLATEICARLASGASLAKVCESGDMPDRKTVFVWLHKGRKGLEPFASFVELYEEAREHGTDAIVEEIFEIADDGHNDWMDTKYGPRVNQEAVGRSKLRVESRMWYLSKIKPKRYGDQLDITTGGDKLPTPIYGGASKNPDIVEGEIVRPMGLPEKVTEAADTHIYKEPKKSKGLPEISHPPMAKSLLDRD